MGSTSPLHVLADPVRARRARDRLEVLTALLGGPSVDPLYRDSVIEIPEDHPVYRWGCKVASCGNAKSSRRDICSPHEREWLRARREGVTRRAFLNDARPVEVRRPDPAAGTLDLRGLLPLTRAEFQWGLFAHTQQASRYDWHASELRAVVRFLRNHRVTSLLELAPASEHVPTRLVGVLREISAELRIVYFTPEETKEAGYIETEHFGVRFHRSRSDFDLTPVSQRWLRDLLWDHLADRLRSPQGPTRRGGLLFHDRRACTELSAFLEAVAPGGGHDPALLTEEHMRRYVADHNKRVREGLPSLAIRAVNGKPSVVTGNTRRFTFNHARAILRDALDSGEAERIGLPRTFITALPYGKKPVEGRRNPFPDEVAQALSDEGNLGQLAERHDPSDCGIRDAWEALVFTGRRCTEVLNLRLECVSRHGGLPLLWHDQTKVGNYGEAIRIPEQLYLRIKERQLTTIARFEDRHGRPPTPAETKQMALFPTRDRNPHGRDSISYTLFRDRFQQWINELDLGRCVAHQARHTLATNLLRHGAGLHHIKQYLGQVSGRMAEHYARVASCEIEDVLHHVWVAGPGSAHPGKLLTSPTQGMSREAARAMAVDLSRSTPAEGGLCTFQPVVRGDACPWQLNCEGCDKFVMSGADLLYWHRKREQWRSLAERAPDDATADYLHQVFEPTSQAIDGLEKALAALGLLDQALAMDLRRPQDYFQRLWSIAFRASDLAAAGEQDDDPDRQSEDPR
ncbi:tyrosine-type recombinase/integrase [Streptomyces sp. NPDC057909]|uniref:tyrosine-type recombinase/integrase n=1 Tax=Streptomyces sp. NPDC057909 TaxID=3346277 RepID=UPI0036ED74E8